MPPLLCRRPQDTASRQTDGASFWRAILRRLASDDSGVALVFTVAVFLFLFVLVLSVYSVGETIRRKEELQNACDAAAQSAAAIEADALSRMAAANRAMAWHYIQMTKEQMDYIVYRFLHEVRDKFQSDIEAVKPKDFALDEHAGYWHFSNTSAAKVANEILRFIPVYKNNISYTPFCRAQWLQFKCHLSGTESHANRDCHEARFMGFGSSKNAIRLGFDDNSIVYYDSHDNDLHFQIGDEGICRQLEESIDIKALADSIAAHRNAIIQLNATYAMIGNAFYSSATKTIPRVLAANLPHPDGDGDPLADFRWAAFVPEFTYPAEYPLLSSAAEDGTATKPKPSFFFGLKNTEEDELLFLNMADGLPGIRSNPVILSDYFADETTRQSATDSIFPIAAGLDQWFIRTTDADARDSDSVSIDRATPFLSEGGILRGYKNANFDEGAQNAWLNTVPVHRGNHVFHIDLGKTLNAGSLPSLFGSILSFTFPGFRGNSIQLIFQYVSQILPLNRINPIQTILGQLLGGADKLLDVTPSCRNDRSYFPDTCANVNDSFGLVAEYEWHTAEWICLYQTKRVTTLRPGIMLSDPGPGTCKHIPLPFGAAFGAPQGTPHAYGDHNPLRMVAEQLKGMLGPGHSRRDYRSTFTNFTNDLPPRPPCHPTTVLKAYCRIYGDDIHLFDENYLGVPARPWLLKQDYFNGAGSIVVALARKRRNVFERLMESTDAPGLASAFSATDRIPAEGAPAPFASSRDRYFVALSAARAAPAPRAGGRGAVGDDSANSIASYGGQPGYPSPPAHDVAFDRAADRNLGPDGHPVLPDGNYRASLPKDILEQTHRLGCPCGSEATERRLDRQWNLSQTDWEPRLVPVRFALTASSSMDSGGTRLVLSSEWDVAAQYPSSPGAYENVPGLVQLLTQIPWHPFEDGADENASAILPTDAADSVQSWIDLFRKRKVY